jgi:hypothetical protein
VLPGLGHRHDGQREQQREGDETKNPHHDSFLT